MSSTVRQQTYAVIQQFTGRRRDHGENLSFAFSLRPLSLLSLNGACTRSGIPRQPATASCSADTSLVSTTTTTSSSSSPDTLYKLMHASRYGLTNVARLSTRRSAGCRIPRTSFRRSSAAAAVSVSPVPESSCDTIAEVRVIEVLL